MATAAAATVTVTEVAPAALKSRKKLIIIIAAAVTLLLAVGAGGAVFMMKKKASTEAAEAAEGSPDAATLAPSPPVARHDPKSVPVFVPLDPFTVNLADREAERYAQLAVTLEIVDSKTGDQIKNHMPVIRSNILLAIADRTASELMGREGKVRLAERIKRETARALGYDVPASEADEAAPGKPRADAKPAPKKPYPDDSDLPVKAVHFSNFIIQ